MKIAIPSNNKQTICGHFGRTAGFMIYEIADNKIVNQEYRPNTFTGHAQGKHQEHNHQQGHGHGHGHSHSGILSALHDCEIVIAGGMGRRLLDDLTQNNKKVFVTKEANIKIAVEAFINQKLDHNENSCCDH